VNSGPLAQGSVRYGSADLDSVTVGFRQCTGFRLCSPPGATGPPQQQIIRGLIIIVAVALGGRTDG
jgi:hypothetical protein